MASIRRAFATSAADRRRWRVVRRRVFERDGWRCRKCGGAGRLECDHVTPIHRGGAAWDEANLQALCRTCHIRKSRLERLHPNWPADWAQLVADMVD